LVGDIRQTAPADSSHAYKTHGRKKTEPEDLPARREKRRAPVKTYGLRKATFPQVD
jgi:hypothetical protein